MALGLPRYGGNGGWDGEKNLIFFFDFFKKYLGVGDPVELGDDFFKKIKW